MTGPPVGRPPPAVGRDSTADYACRCSVRCVRGRGFDSRRLHEAPVARAPSRGSGGGLLPAHSAAALRAAATRLLAFGFVAFGVQSLWLAVQGSSMLPCGAWQ